MKKIFLTSIFYIFALTKTVFSQDTEIDPCKNINFKPVLNFTTSYGKLRYDHSYPQSKLRDLGETFGIVEHGMFTAGLSIASIEWEIVLDTITKITDNGDICVVPSIVDVFIGFQDPTIYISNHLKQGTCEYNLVLRHEHQHQQLNVVALEYYIPRIRTDLEQRLREVKPGHAASLDKTYSVTAVMTDAYIEIITPYVERFKASLLKEQGLLDSLENYEAENKICKKGIFGT